MKFLRLLLVLAFIAAQSFALAHATRHELLQQDDTACAICLAADALALPTAYTSLPALPLFHDQQQVAAVRPDADRRPFDRPHSRGPPLFLA